MTDWTHELPRTVELLEEGQRQGLHSGAQICVERLGRTVISGASGEARPGEPMTESHLLHWLSSGKPVAAVAIMQLVERGRLELTDAVAQHWPEFGQGGKDEITVRHLLTHTGGFRKLGTDWPHASREELIQRIAAAPLEPNWIPGEKAGYHTSTSWYTLGVLVERLDGRPFSHYVREAIFEPLEMNDCWIGMTDDAYERDGSRVAELRHTNTSDNRLHRLSCREGIQLVSPGESMIGPANQVAHLYEMFLNHGDRNGVQILEPDSVQQMTTRQRRGLFDESFMNTIDWGLGLIIDSKRYGTEALPYGYGKHASDRTFGHSGNQSSTAFADPEWQLIVTLAMTGMPGERPHQKRIKPIAEAIYEDLGLVESH